MATDNRMNLCTVTLEVAPEAHGEDDVRLTYGCVKDGFTVQACKWYRPLNSAGLVSPYECHWFSGGCNCPRARKYAMQRADRLLRKMLADRKRK